MRFNTVIAGVLGLCLASLPAASYAQTPPSLVLELATIDRLSAADPAAALELVETALAGINMQNPREVFDLFLLKATLLEAQGTAEEVAKLYAQLGSYVALHREVLGRDPTVLYERAAAMFMQLDDLRSASEALRLVLGEQRNGGMSGAVLATTLDRLAALSRQSGAPQEAAAYAEAAVAARTQAPDVTRSGNEGGFREVEVFYATDRARTGDPRPAEFYGYGRGPLELGRAMVTIPETHQPGLVEAPSIWRLEFGPNPARHVVLHSVTPSSADEFYAAMNARLEANDASEAFVFVHGFNVRFDAAAKRAAQLAYDMNFHGVPVLYSWPSRGSTVGYIPDTAVVRLSGRRLSLFLDDLVARSGAQTIHLIAHSMGNRALTDALELFALRNGIGPDSAPVFDQVLFAAPDVDAGLFAQMLPTIRPVARRLTLYASEEDWALEASSQLHGDAPRAGQGGAVMLASPSIDSVDMSELGEDMLAHSYFADDSSALADMVALFWRNAAPNQRCGLEPVAERQAVPLWTYRPGTCADRKLVELMSFMQSEDVTDIAGATAALEGDAAALAAIAPLLD
ncbi:MAG: alpha/beta hydrolase [Rhodobacteraceae bacterium]|nr:alpha/beta hydrolase [Paracoccaceae bacterium]